MIFEKGKDILVKKGVLKGEKVKVKEIHLKYVVVEHYDKHEGTTLDVTIPKVNLL